MQLLILALTIAIFFKDCVSAVELKPVENLSEILEKTKFNEELLQQGEFLLATMEERSTSLTNLGQVGLDFDLQEGIDRLEIFRLLSLKALSQNLYDCLISISNQLKLKYNYNTLNSIADSIWVASSA